MNLIPRVEAALVALAMVFGVVYLGAHSGRGAQHLLCFGIAAALAAPIVLALCTYALSRDNNE
jgi:hypothetical protein